MADNDDDESGGVGFDPELLRSYRSFASRAIKQRLLMVGLVFVLGAVLTFVAFRFLPRTFSCTTVLLAEASQVLEQGGGAQTILAAPSLIMRHENLEAIIRETSLVKKYRERRPPLLRTKDRMIQSLFGEFSDKTVTDILVGTLEARLSVKIEGSTLVISADWTDGQTAAEIAEAARESFVRTRHSAELAAFQEKLAILDGHAAKLREEIERVAQQIQSIREAKSAEAAKAAGPVASASTPLPRIVVRRQADLPEADLQSPVLKESLEAKKRKLAELESDRERRLREERGKVAELKLRLMPSHPEVVTAEQRLAVLAQEPSELSLLRAEVSSIESELKQRDALARRGTPAPLGGTTGASTIDPVPREIVGLLEDRNIDPALTAQLYGAIAKYSTLRDDVRSSRIQLDTAQAAFNHRYKIVVPADAPGSPIKPKIRVILGGGLAASLLFALLLPILAELRTGIMIERWQVQQLRLPVLAELRLPALSSGADAGVDRPRD